jgi:hypothetical protein
MIVFLNNSPGCETSYNKEHIKSKHIDKESCLIMIGQEHFLYTERFVPLLPSNLLIDIQNGKKLLIIDTSTECSFNLVDLIYDNIIIGLNIPEENILLVCGSIDFKDKIIEVSTKLNKKPIKCEVYYFSERMSKKFVMQEDGYGDSPLLKDTHYKTYINLNRHWRSHRIALLAMLYNSNLLDYGYNSLDLHSNKSWRNDLIEADTLYRNLELLMATDFEKLLPLHLDTDNFIRNLAHTTQIGILPYFKSSLLSLVTETNFNDNEPIYLTEKTFKSIGQKHPFIIVSKPFTLKLLKDLGYKTFNEVIDERYDLETNDSKRLKMIVSEIDRISKLNENELKHFKSICLPIVEYNYSILMNKKNYIKELL